MEGSVAGPFTFIFCALFIMHVAFELKSFLKNKVSALAGVAKWIDHLPANQRAAGLIPSQGTCCSCRPGPQQGALEKQLHIVSLLLFLPPFPLSKNK